MVAVGRPRLIVDVTLATRLIGRGHHDRAAAMVVGVSVMTMRRFRRRLIGARRGGRPRSTEPGMAPPRSRPQLEPVRDEGGRVIGHRLGLIAA